MNLTRLKKKRDRRRKGRDRQRRKYKAAGERGHRRAAARHVEALEKLNRLIDQERERRQLSKVYSREEWNAAPPRGSFARQTTIKAGVQHHTAMQTLSADASVADEKARMRQLQSIHQGQGWTDIGYALVAFPSGRIYEGRPSQYVGAHTLGHNTGFAGWSLDGNYETSRPTKKAVEACRRCREILNAERVRLYGHYELNATACPGKNLKPYLRREI